MNRDRAKYVTGGRRVPGLERVYIQGCKNPRCFEVSGEFKFGNTRHVLRLLVEAANRDEAIEAAECVYRPENKSRGGYWEKGPFVEDLGPVGLDVLARRGGHPTLPGF